MSISTLQYIKNKTDPVWYNMHSRIPRAQDFLGRSGGFYDPYGRHNNINPVIAIPTADNSNKEFDQICDETAYKIKETILKVIENKTKEKGQTTTQSNQDSIWIKIRNYLGW